MVACIDGPVTFEISIGKQTTVLKRVGNGTLWLYSVLQKYLSARACNGS